MGIEPTRSAWEAEVLPLNYTCERLSTGLYSLILSKSLKIVNISVHFYPKKVVRSAVERVFSGIALANELFNLVLDALERIVNALDVPPQHLGDFLIAFFHTISRAYRMMVEKRRCIESL